MLCGRPTVFKQEKEHKLDVTITAELVKRWNFRKVNEGKEPFQKGELCFFTSKGNKYGKK